MWGAGCLLLLHPCVLQSPSSLMLRFQGPCCLLAMCKAFPQSGSLLQACTLPAAGRPDAIACPEHKPGFAIGVSPLKVSTAEPGAGPSEMAQRLQEDRGSWVALGADKEKVGHSCKAGGGNWSPAGAGVQICSLCNSRRQEDPTLTCWGFCTMAGRGFTCSRSVAGMLWAGHLSCKAALASAENCPLNVRWQGRTTPNDKQAVTAFRVSQIFHLWVSKHCVNTNCWASCERTCFHV